MKKCLNAPPLTIIFALCRSEYMKLYQLTVPKDDANKVLNRFGSLGKVQFLDLNAETSPLVLPFTNMIRALEESERKLIYLIDQYEKYNVKLSQPGDIE